MAALFVAGILFQLPAYGWFKQYCSRAAEIEKRTDELESDYGRNDNGLNAYERRLFWQIMTKGYLEYDDIQLVALGARVRTATLCSWAFVVGWIAVVVWLEKSICSA